MRKKILVTLCSTILLSAPLLFGCSNPNKGDNELSNSQLEVRLPEAFYGHNFIVVAGNINESGCALIFDDKGTPEIQNGSAHVDFYDIGFELLPMYQDVISGEVTLFLPFKVTEQVIDDGYFKNGNEYRFYLRYKNPDYYCAVSLNDRTITTPDKVLMEGMM